MKIRTLKYHIRQGVDGLMKNNLMSLASIATVAACTFILIISLCIVLNIDSMLEQFEKKVGISIYIGNEVSDDEVLEIQKKISDVANVKSVEFFSETDALEWAKEKWGDDGGILSGFEDDNPFPRSFEINIDGIKYQKDIIKKLEALQLSFESELLKQEQAENDLTDEQQNAVSEGDAAASTEEAPTEELTPIIGREGYEFRGIEKIRHAQRESEILMTINTALRIIGLVLVFILCAVAIAIIMNTIKLTVFIRKNEINIMKYVGATDWFIRWPFVIEGLLIGLFGSVISSIVCWIGYDKTIEVMRTKLFFLTNVVQFKAGAEIFSFIMPITILIGIALGVFGSVTSLRKHLNV